MPTSTRSDRIVRAVTIPTDGPLLGGSLALPAAATGVVVFAHGSNSGRFSPRNQFVAEVLQKAGLGTLLLDLLSDVESRDRVKVFDVELLAQRLLVASLWLVDQPGMRHLRLGYFGASTGAGAALIAAAGRPELVAAVVSRGGRPDLATNDLHYVKAPTLFIVGGCDEEVLRLNRFAQAQLRCPCELKIVPGASHLFEEPGTLEQAAQFAADWFLKYLDGHTAA